MAVTAPIDAWKSNPQCARCGVTAVGNESEKCRRCAYLPERAHPILLDMLDVHRALPNLPRQWEVEEAVSGLGRIIADKLDAEIHERTHPPVPGMTPDFADGYRTAIESVREWCGVQQEEERNG